MEKCPRDARISVASPAPEVVQNESCVNACSQQLSRLCVIITGRQLVTRTMKSTAILILAIHLVGCSSSRSRQPVPQTVVSADVAPGTILVDVLEGGQPPQHYWQYEVQPAAGTVRMVKEEEIQNRYTRHIPETFQGPTGAIEACAGGKLTRWKVRGRCMTSKKETEEFLVIEDKSGVTACHWKPQDSRGIRGFAWSPNSRSIVVLLNIE
jgi:hypothetical protein